MSWFSRGLHAVGGLAEKVAPYVGLIPGVGTIAGGAIGGLGALAHGDGLSGALKYGAMGAAGGYGGAALRGLSTGGKAAAIGTSLLHGGGPPRAPAGSGGGGYDVNDPSQNIYADGSGPSDNPSGGFLSAAGGYLKSALGDINPITAGLGATGVINAGHLGAKADKYAGQALGDAQGSYAERAGLRKAGIDQMLHPQVPDTSNLTRIRSNNSYSQLSPAAQ